MLSTLPIPQEGLKRNCGDLYNFTAEVKGKLGVMQRNLSITKLHSGTDSLPDGFQLGPAMSSTQTFGTHQDSRQGVGRRSVQRRADGFEPPLLRVELQSLVWMHPFNAGRARYLRPHVAALSNLLSLAGIKHHAWAVSVEGTSLPLEAYLHAFGSVLIVEAAAGALSCTE